MFGLMQPKKSTPPLDHKKALYQLYLQVVAWIMGISKKHNQKHEVWEEYAVIWKTWGLVV